MEPGTRNRALAIYVVNSIPEIQKNRNRDCPCAAKP
jgi:hypothetical protein